jgi:uncharacterized protein YkwD
MLNRTPPPKNTSNVINSYRKRRMQKGPYLLYGAVALVLLGAIMLVVWLASPGKPLGAMFATDTPTVTVTPTVTTTSTPTITSTVTITPTITITFTPTGDQSYVIQEGDSLESIAQKFNLGNEGSQIIYYANQEDMEANAGVIFVGQTITIPPAGSVLPTTTPIPANLPRGTKVEYRVLPGDTLAGIAIRFNSITEDIIEENDITDANALQVGDVLQIPVNLVTATATLPSTSTPVTPTVVAQATSTTGGSPAATTAASGGSAQCPVQENNTYVSELQNLINSERTKTNAPALSTNAQLATAARNHAVDMLCNSYFSDIGLDKSTPQDRVTRAGFSASLVVEAIYAAPDATPQAALAWWMQNTQNRSDLMKADLTAVGIAYVKSDASLFGGYFVVVMAK